MPNYLRKVLITGAQGQLGCALQQNAMASEFLLIPCARADLDITNSNSITAALDQHQPDVVINTAAYTAVDKAEHEAELANTINHLAAQQLALACEKRRIRLIHLSTDYVFDGKCSQPYREDDTVNPINVYGKTKWLGEQAVRKHCQQHIILRVSAVFSEFGHNFFKTMLKLGLEKKELRVVADQITCPTYAGDIATTIYNMLKHQHTGTYHFCNQPNISWHAFAVAILQEAAKHQALAVQDIKAITSAEYPTPAMRPAYSVLDCTKIKNTFGILQPDFHAAIRTIFARR